MRSKMEGDGPSSEPIEFSKNWMITSGNRW